MLLPSAGAGAWHCPRRRWCACTAGEGAPACMCLYWRVLQVFRMSSDAIGCSLAEAAESPSYLSYLEQAGRTPRSLHVVYINTSLRTKATAHSLVPTITCTSSNVVQTVLQAFAQVGQQQLSRQDSSTWHVACMLHCTEVSPGKWHAVLCRALLTLQCTGTAASIGTSPCSLITLCTADTRGALRRPRGAWCCHAWPGCSLHGQHRLVALRLEPATCWIWQPGIWWWRP